MSAFLSKLFGLVFTFLVVLYFIHLFFAGGFKDSAVMIKDDINVLKSCPGKPSVFLDFIWRESKQSYIYWEGWDKFTIPLDKEGASAEVCDKSPGVF